MDSKPPLLHRPKPPSSLPSVAISSRERDVLKPRRAVRLFPLLLMTIYAAYCILRIVSSLSSSSSSSSSSAFPHPLQATNSRVVVHERTWDVRSSLQTHIISSPKETSLRARQEGPPPASVSCSALINGDASAAMDWAVLCCDRSHFRTDVCYMRGRVATVPRSLSIVVDGRRLPRQEETIRPYTRKWEASVMRTIDVLKLVAQPSEDDGGGGNATGASPRCDVRHEVPAVVFSTGGYTGNVYHEFSDGLLPLYATAGRFGGEVVLVVLEYHPWWVAKYGTLVRLISNYEMVDLARDKRVHCFPEMIVGLRIHGELTIDPRLMPTGKGIRDFQDLLAQGFGRSRRKDQQLPPTPLLPAITSSRKSKLVILVRSRSRVLQNLRQVIKASQAVGFDVQLLNPKKCTPMPDLYDSLHAADAVLAVHGAALTHLLFMRPAAVLIQIVPLGLGWPAEEFYGQPARAAGLDYMEYKVLPEESSLWRHYDRRDPVIADPAAITRRGWPEIKKVYLDHQNVRVNIRRFRMVLASAYSHVTRTQPRL
ncbi:hypothetical protein Taro_023818 [Colocasia esculenta]|uniref:Glycosyltransferase 61 catalytic domain-containing protein n=1 Tax=Colocasia esculenta TaxID=4460 RepID=A0A843V555_COLES|nr:hypothetical protein [Colocasia esculenta]